MHPLVPKLDLDQRHTRQAQVMFFVELLLDFDFGALAF
jgi:hypothetical protein